MFVRSSSLARSMTLRRVVGDGPPFTFPMEGAQGIAVFVFSFPSAEPGKKEGLAVVDALPEGVVFARR